MGLVVAIFIALSQVNLDTLRSNVQNILADAVGMPVEIDGRVSWKFSLRPRVELNQVRIKNADWASEKYAFTAAHIDVSLDLISVLQDRPTIRNVKIYDAVVSLEQNNKGEYSIMPGAIDKPDDAAPDSDSESVADKDAAPAKYPFEDPGLGGVEIKNLTAHILGETYVMNGFSVRYFPREGSREYGGWIKPDTDVYPFIVSYAEYDSERNVYPVRVAISTGGEALIANVALDADSRMPIDFAVSGDVPNIAAVAGYFNIDLGSIPSMQIDLAGAFSQRKLTLRPSTVWVRGTEITLSGDYDWSRKKPKVNLKLKSNRIDLMELVPELYYSSNKSRPDNELTVFQDIPLFGHQLRSIDFSLRVDIGKLIVYRQLSLSDLDLRANMTGGVGRIDGHCSIAEGDVRIGADVEIDIDGRTDLVIAGVGEKIYVGKILSQVGQSDLISDLPVNLEFYLRGGGVDLAEFMQTVTGPVQIYSVGSGYAHSALVTNMYGSDFLTSLRHSIQDLFRSEKKHNQIKISCAAINAKIRDGRIETENGVAVETNAINLRLAGNLDLGAERIKLALTTVPVRGLKLSLTGNVVNSIEIAGNLAAPDIKISGAAVAGKVASATGIGLLLAPFTGGIGLAAGAGIGLLAGDLLENWLADDHPCKTALSRGAPDWRRDPEWLGAPVQDLIKTVLKD